jgi:hypothetical protein
MCDEGRGKCAIEIDRLNNRSEVFCNCALLASFPVLGLLEQIRNNVVHRNVSSQKIDMRFEAIHKTIVF